MTEQVDVYEGGFFFILDKDSLKHPHTTPVVLEVTEYDTGTADGVRAPCSDTLNNVIRQAQEGEISLGENMWALFKKINGETGEEEYLAIHTSEVPFYELAAAGLQGQAT